MIDPEEYDDNTPDIDDANVFDIEALRLKLNGALIGYERQIDFENLRVERLRFVGYLVRIREHIASIDKTLTGYVGEERAERDTRRAEVRWIETLYRLEDKR